MSANGLMAATGVSDSSRSWAPLPVTRTMAGRGLAPVGRVRGARECHVSGATRERHFLFGVRRGGVRRPWAGDRRDRSEGVDRGQEHLRRGDRRPQPPTIRARPGTCHQGCSASAMSTTIPRRASPRDTASSACRSRRHDCPRLRCVGDAQLGQQCGPQVLRREWAAWIASRVGSVAVTRRRACKPDPTGCHPTGTSEDTPNPDSVTCSSDDCHRRR